MPSTDWIINSQAGTSTFAAARISGVVRDRSSQGADTVSFLYPSGFDGVGLPFESKATISKIDSSGDQKTWFTGWVTSLPRSASGGDESLSVRLSGPWYWLEQMVFESGWTYTQNGAKPLIVGYTSHLLLNSGGNGLITTGTQIRAVLQYVLDMFTADGREAPFQIGAITPVIYAPIDEVRDLSCAEVIRKQLRWHPDAVCWFDSSTVPPTFHCKSRAELVAVDLPIATTKDSGRVSRWSLTPRYDLVRPSVAIRYETKSTIDGRDTLRITDDIYPIGKTGREPGALTATVDLQGAKTTTARASLTVETIPIDLKAAAALAWWKRKIPELNNPAIGAITINKVGRVRRNLDGTTTDLANGGSLPNEVIEGQVAPWMTINNTSISAQQERVSIEVKYAVYDGDSTQAGATKMSEVNKPFTYSYDLVTTDGLTGDYSTIATFESGDPQPLGLAQALFSIVQVLHFDGDIELTEVDLGDRGPVGVGNVVNLSNGLPEWAAMRALVQTQREDFDRGVTTLTVGPPAHLGVTDLAELLRVNRTRMRFTNSGAQGSGGIGSNDLRLGKQTANSSRGVSDQVYQLWVIKADDKVITLDAATGIARFEAGASNAKTTTVIDLINGTIMMTDAAHGGRSIALELAKCVGGNANRALSIQETNVCETVNGVDVTKKMLVLRSPSY